MPSHTPSLPVVIKKLRLWLGADLSHRVDVSEAVLARWESGAVRPDDAAAKFLMAVFRNECSKYARPLLKDLAQWHYADNAIAASLALDPGTISKWKTGENTPTLDHLAALEKLHADTRSALFPAWVAALRADFLCSIADPQTVDHGPMATADLIRSRQSSLNPEFLKIGFPFVLDVRFEDLHANVRGHTFVDRRWLKPVFIILVNSKDSADVQRQTIIQEIQAHVFTQFSLPLSPSSTPASLFKTIRARGHP